MVKVVGEGVAVTVGLGVVGVTLLQLAALRNMNIRVKEIAT